MFNCHFSAEISIHCWYSQGFENCQISGFWVLLFDVLLDCKGMCEGEFELFPITSQSFARFGFYCVVSVNCEGYMSR